MDLSNANFETEVYRYKCKTCRRIFCMPNCGECKQCGEVPAQETSLCGDCVEKIFVNADADKAEEQIVPGEFIALNHFEVMHRCKTDKEFHLWRKG